MIHFPLVPSVHGPKLTLAWIFHWQLFILNMFLNVVAHFY